MSRAAPGKLAGDGDQTEKEFGSVLGRTRKQMPGETLAPTGLPARQTLVAKPGFHRRSRLLQAGFEQMAFGDWKDRIPSSWRPEADHRSVVTGADREIRPVAVPPGVGHADDGKDLEVAETPQVLQRLPNLPRLVLELDPIVETLPDASAAGAEGRAAMGDAIGGGREDPLGSGLGVSPFQLGHAGLDHVAGHGSGHEHHEVADLGDARAAESQVGDAQLDELACAA